MSFRNHLAGTKADICLSEPPALFYSTYQLFRVVVTVEGAEPTKPTLEQLSGNTDFSYGGSFDIGGMALSAGDTDSNSRPSLPNNESWSIHDTNSARHLGSRKTSVPKTRQ